jgi:hypothetical protein
MNDDTDDPRATAREVFAEFREALEEGVRAAVPAFLKLVTVGVTAYLAAKATQRTIAALKVAIGFGILGHAVSATAGLSGAAFMTTGLFHVGGLAVLAALSGHDVPAIGVGVAVPGIAVVGTAAYWATLSTSGWGIIALFGGIFGVVGWATVAFDMAERRGYV